MVTLNSHVLIGIEVLGTSTLAIADFKKKTLAIANMRSVRTDRPNDHGGLPACDATASPALYLIEEL